RVASRKACDVCSEAAMRATRASSTADKAARRAPPVKSPSVVNDSRNARTTKPGKRGLPAIGNSWFLHAVSHAGHSCGWYVCSRRALDVHHRQPPERSAMLMLHRHSALQFNHPLHYGAILHDNGVQFVVFSRTATGMRVLLYEHVNDREPSETIVFD